MLVESHRLFFYSLICISSSWSNACRSASSGGALGGENLLLADGPRQRSSCCRWDSCAGIFVGHPRYCLLVAESEREGDRPTAPLFSALLAGPPTSLLRTIHLLSISATIHLFMSTSSCPRSFPASFVSAEPEHLHAAGESKPLWEERHGRQLL